MSLTKISTAVAVALALSSTPVLASSQAVRASSSSLSAQSVGVAKASARKATLLQQANGAKTNGVVLGIVALGLAVTAVVIASDGNDGPTSP